MNTAETVVTLFDFDGVIMDTETQYTVFQDEQGRKYLNEEDFDRRIKGQALLQIYERYFSDQSEVQLETSAELYVYEQEVFYEYVPGIEAFTVDLRRNDTKIAVITSSNGEKMAGVYNVHPESKRMVDRVLAGEMSTRSKPASDRSLLGMGIFGTIPGNTYVFEDSFHDLQAGMTSGTIMIGLATTNTREAITGKAHYIIDDLTGMTYEKMTPLYK